MNAFELLSDYAFVIIFVLIAFFQWFVSKFRNKGEDVFEWPDDDDQGQSRQEEDPLAEIRRRLEQRMGGGTAAPPPPPQTERQPSPQRTSTLQQPRAVKTLTSREPVLRKARQGFVERERDALAAKKLLVDAKTEALAASLEAARSEYGAKPDRLFAANRRGRIQKYIATPESLRDAILLQEILGTPRSRRVL